MNEDKNPITRPEWLSHKHFIFCETYIRTNNKSESARQAGYSAKTAGVTGCQLLKHPNVKRYLEYRVGEINRKAQEAEEKEERASIAGADEILEYFSRVMRGEETTYNYRGLEIPMPVSERTRAASELAKRVVDNQSMDNPVNIVIDIPRPTQKKKSRREVVCDTQK